MCSSSPVGGGIIAPSGIKSLADLRTNQAAQEADALMNAGFKPGLEDVNDGIRRNAIARGYEIDDSGDSNTFTAKKDADGVSSVFSVFPNRKTLTQKRGRGTYTVIR